MQGYYQESGRAGRDGLPAECILMAAPKDYPRLIQLLRKGGRAGKGKFQLGMELLNQVRLHPIDRPECAISVSGNPKLAVPPQSVYNARKVPLLF